MGILDFGWEILDFRYGILVVLPARRAWLELA